MLAALHEQPLLIALLALLVWAASSAPCLDLLRFGFVWKAIPLVSKSMRCCRKPNAVSVVIPGCRPYSEAITAAMRLTSVPRVARKPFKHSPILLDVEPQPLDAEHGTEKDPWLHGFVKTSVSVAPNVFRPVQSTPSWALQK